MTNHKYAVGVYRTVLAVLRTPGRKYGTYGVRQGNYYALRCSFPPAPTPTKSSAIGSIVLLSLSSLLLSFDNSQLALFTSSSPVYIFPHCLWFQSWVGLAIPTWRRCAVKVLSHYSMLDPFPLFFFFFHLSPQYYLRPEHQSRTRLMNYTFLQMIHWLVHIWTVFIFSFSLSNRSF